ncbi:hypothetical protein AB7160_01810 [Morganella morganii]|uniref:hypothetical protein n=1 Tax=Morganella morganii TaxID=582 RepID=UPI00339C69EE
MKVQICQSVNEALFSADGKPRRRGGTATRREHNGIAVKKTVTGHPFLHKKAG